MQLVICFLSLSVDSAQEEVEEETEDNHGTDDIDAGMLLVQ